MAATTVGTFLDALKTRLSALSGLSGVAIYTGPVGDVQLGTECCIFAADKVTADYDYKTIKRLEVWETYEINGRIWVVQAVSGEAGIKAVRDRAITIMGAVHNYLASLTDTPSFVTALTVDRAEIIKWTLEQYAVDGGRDARIEFTLHVKAHFLPS